MSTEIFIRQASLGLLKAILKHVSLLHGGSGCQLSTAVEYMNSHALLALDEALLSTDGVMAQGFWSVFTVLREDNRLQILAHARLLISYEIDRFIPHAEIDFFEPRQPVQVAA